MKYIILLLLLAACLCIGSQHAGQTYSLKQTDKSLALLKGDAAIWQLNFAERDGKPYFHPLRLPNGDDTIALRPADHPWHLGLWWSWKYINGVNYWEFNKKTGKYQGTTEVTQVNITQNADHSAKVEMELSYHLPNKPPVLTEKRVLTIAAPDAAGSYTIDWSATFTAGGVDVKLDRTPPAPQKNGVSWGGYAGLSIRLNAAAKKWIFACSTGARGVTATNGKSASWVDFSGSAGGIAIFDSPRNPRHPSPWYCNQQLPYFSPAFLYQEPFSLPAGKSLTLRYRVLVHAAGADLANEWGKFEKSEQARTPGKGD